MARIIASRPIGIIRGKNKVNGSGKTKKRGNMINGSTWQE